MFKKVGKWVMAMQLNIARPIGRKLTSVALARVVVRKNVAISALFNHHSVAQIFKNIVGN
jgi:hypothetical protein